MSWKTLFTRSLGDGGGDGGGGRAASLGRAFSSREPRRRESSKRRSVKSRPPPPFCPPARPSCYSKVLDGKHDSQPSGSAFWLR